MRVRRTHLFWLCLQGGSGLGCLLLVQSCNRSLDEVDALLQLCALCFVLLGSSPAHACLMEPVLACLADLQT